MSPRPLTALVAAACALGGAGTATAAISDHPLPQNDPGVSDLTWERPIATWNGAVWVGQGDAGALARFAPGGQVSEVAIPEAEGDNRGPADLSPGGDGLWMLTNQGRRAVLLAADGQFTKADLPDFVGAATFAAAPDSGFWYSNHLVNEEHITRVTRDGFTPFPMNLAGYAVIAPLGGGAAWGARDDGTLVRIGGDGVVTPHSLPGPCRPSLGCSLPGITSMVPLANGGAWYTRAGLRNISTGTYRGFNTRVAMVGRVAPNGRATEWELPNPRVGPHSIVRGPDGRMWFATADGLGRVDGAGRVRLFTLPGGRRADGLTVGPDRALWFVDRRLNRVTRLTVNDALALGGPEIRSANLRQVRGRIGVRLACPASGSACRGTLRITHPRATVGSRAFHIASGRSAVVQVPMSAAATRRVRAARTTVTVTVRPRSGGEGDRRDLVLRR